MVLKDLSRLVKKLVLRRHNMGKSFKENLDPKKEIFVELKKRGKYPWWENLKKNKDISIQIRKDNYIDVYYNGGAVLKKLEYNETKKAFTAEIHPNYIPLDDNDYLPLSLTSDGVKFSKELTTMNLSQFEEKELKFVINRIGKYHNQKSEKAIQFNFIAYDPYIIDAEFQLPGEKIRIDLVRLDKSVNKIVLIEVKRMEDPRLFADSKEKTQSKKENIYDQLKKYHKFAVDYDNILDYYKKVLQVKKYLGLLRPELENLSINNWQIECKPLLVFGDCKPDWIEANKESIKEKIKDVAYGAYYFEKPESTLELKPKSKRRRYFF